MSRWMVFGFALWGTVAQAQIAPECEGIGRPSDYDERTQQDFLANYYALTASASALHGPIPNRPGSGTIGVDLNVMPPLSCEKRLALDASKTEDTNVSPVLPRIMAHYSFPEVADRLVFYAGVGMLPPVNVGGTRNLVLSAEGGLGIRVVEHFDVGVRAHTTLQRTFGDIATKIEPDDPDVEDIYVGSTWGTGVQLGSAWSFGPAELTPYVSVGYLDASTFFIIGDNLNGGDGNSPLTENLHPYAGVDFSVGVDVLLFEHFRVAAEFYGAPGGYSNPAEGTVNLEPVARYGRLYTARFRLGYQF